MTSHRILVLVARDGNRQHLVEWLDEEEDYDSLLPEAIDAGSLDQDVDCVVVDGRAFERHREELQALVAADEVIFLPTLLVSESAAPSALDHSLIDDVLVTPIRSEQLRLRLDNLLERRRQSAELADKARRLRGFRAAVEQAGHSIMITDTDGTIQYVNPAFESTTGYEPDEVLGENPRILKSGEHDESFYADLWGTILDGEIWEGEMVNEDANGEQFVIEMTIAPIFEEAGDVDRFVAVATDVTERKERERELQETKKTLESIIEASPNAIVMLDEAGRVVLWNHAATTVLGWTPEEVVRQEPPFLLDKGDGTLEAFMDRLDAGNEITGQERVIPTKTGEKLDVSLAAASVTVDNEVVGYMAVIQDISDRKAYERRIEDQRDTLELLNQVVRHDIRNDMQAVIGMVEMLEGRVEDAAEEYLEGIQESGHHAADLTITARDLTRTMLEDEMELEPVGLHSVIQSEVDEADGSFDEASVRLDGAVPDVQVEANDLLGSVFRNLLKNAVQHNQSEDPVVTVSVTVSDGQAEIQVADNGPGIPDDRKGEIFGKGETGLDSQGTGVGLYLVQTLVEGYDGSVRVTDNDPVGSVFIVELPVIKE